jgi:nicotinamide phosphoribosyltransferase
LETYETGILSVVSDTFDLWKVLDVYLPKFKTQILNRDGKLVIRPDSGNPADILCGYNTSNNSSDVSTNHSSYKGVVECLWDIFGGQINKQGYKVLDPHIGAIYGDSITIEKANTTFVDANPLLSNLLHISLAFSIVIESPYIAPMCGSNTLYPCLLI